MHVLNIIAKMHEMALKRAKMHSLEYVEHDHRLHFFCPSLSLRNVAKREHCRRPTKYNCFHGPKDLEKVGK